MIKKVNFIDGIDGVDVQEEAVYGRATAAGLVKVVDKVNEVIEHLNKGKKTRWPMRKGERLSFREDFENSVVETKKWKVNKATIGSPREKKLLEIGWEPIGVEDRKYIIFKAPASLESSI